jgi:hypothetical protein
MAFRDQNNIPIYPGAYFGNTGTLGDGGNASAIFPIYGSIADYSRPYNSLVADNYYLVLPGFKLVVYSNTDYSSITITCDNTSGTQIKTFVPNSGDKVDKGKSCKLYYNGTELNSVYDTTYYYV